MNAKRPSGKEYQTPGLTIVEVFSEGILCESINGIGDLDFIYDENDKEYGYEENSVFNSGGSRNSMRMRT